MRVSTVFCALLGAVGVVHAAPVQGTAVQEVTFGQNILPLVHSSKAVEYETVTASIHSLRRRRQDTTTAMNSMTIATSSSLQILPTATSTTTPLSSTTSLTTTAKSISTAVYTSTGVATSGSSSNKSTLPLSTTQPSFITTLTSVSTNFGSTTSYTSKTVPTTTALDPTASSVVPEPFDPRWKVDENSIRTGKPSLKQDETNGKSKLGTFRADKYMQYKGQKAWGDTKNCPWGSKTASNTNTYINPPDTGVTQTYEWTIERGVLAPDGVNRSMILVNGAFPGPAIEANWGDTIQVTVHNKITGPEEGTAIHWHGMLQKNSPWEDGVPGITQCPIPPGQSFTYSFRADLYGTSWWHAHYSAQYSAGVFGAMIIHGPDQDELKYDMDLGPILLSDYYHRDYYSIVQDVMGTDIKKTAPKSDNNLINGKGVFNCSAMDSTHATDIHAVGSKSCTPNAGLAKFNVTAGQTYRLRLINAAAEGIQKFSIDNHDLTVVAYDFVPIQPHTLKTVTLGVGQRADVLLTANQKSTGIHWIRSSMTKCSLTNQPNGYALLYYENSNKESVPDPKDTHAPLDTTDPCANDDLTTMIPYYPITPPSQSDTTQKVEINLAVNATGHLVWTMNNSTFRTNYNKPILHALLNGDDSGTFPKEWNAYNFGNSTSIRIILNNLTPISHPMHIHGHNMYVLSSTNTIVQDPVVVNPQNPARRDVQMLPPKGQIMIQIDADNPGVWPLHCHIAWHVSGGLYMNILERPDEITNYKMPDQHKDLCRRWDAYTSTATVDQIDSGLKVRRNNEMKGRRLRS